MPSITRERFVSLVTQARERHSNTLAVPLVERLLSDQLTPVLAYRRLVAPDERTAPSVLLVSVVRGERQGRYSMLGARPLVEVTAFGHIVSVRDHRKTGRPVSDREGDPLLVLRELTRDLTLLRAEAEEAGGKLPDCALGGWFGFASYDTVRYAEPEKLTRDNAPPDDRKLPDMHFGLYPGIVVFDHVDKLVHVVQLAMVAPGSDPGEAYDHAIEALAKRVSMVETIGTPMASGRVEGDTSEAPAEMASNMTREGHRAMVEKALRYIRAGDIFQVVVGQRFEKRSPADPFEVYRSLRAVNPSPYMTYLQGHGCILVASSPEILCRVHDEGGKRIVTNRPLAGTRKRGTTPEADAALEAELLADEKERAEHIMLVDLGRNDVGKVAQSGSVELDSVMSIERYSHVMHISSTVSGELREGMDCWDALRAALPVGTISGAPKVRAMQIIDELEPVRRGPYGGGFGHAGLDGQMDIALALRTIVVPTDLSGKSAGTDATDAEGTWAYHIQAAGGIVADSVIDAEYEETVNKAAALARAIEVAERAFRPDA